MLWILAIWQSRRLRSNGIRFDREPLSPVALPRQLLSALGAMVPHHSIAIHLASALCLDIAAQDRVHPGEMAFALRLEKIEDVGIDPQMHRLLGLRLNDFRLVPEILAEVRSFRRISSRSALSFPQIAERYSCRSGLGHVCPPFSPK